LSRWLVAWLLSSLAGTLLHFVYGWWPNALTAIFTPVNESVWEHLKLLFWPYLAAAWLLVRREREPWPAWTGHLAALLSMPVLLLGVYYALKAGFGFERLWFDLALYYLSMAAGFALARHIGRHSSGRCAAALLLPVCVYALLLTLFSFAAPGLPVFVSA